MSSLRKGIFRSGNQDFNYRHSQRLKGTMKAKLLVFHGLKFATEMFGHYYSGL